MIDQQNISVHIVRLYLFTHIKLNLPEREGSVWMTNSWVLTCVVCCWFKPNKPHWSAQIQAWCRWEFSTQLQARLWIIHQPKERESHIQSVENSILISFYIFSTSPLLLWLGYCTYVISAGSIRGRRDREYFKRRSIQLSNIAPTQMDVRRLWAAKMFDNFIFFSSLFSPSLRVTQQWEISERWCLYCEYTSVSENCGKYKLSVSERRLRDVQSENRKLASHTMRENFWKHLRRSRVWAPSTVNTRAAAAAVVREKELAGKRATSLEGKCAENAKFSCSHMYIVCVCTFNWTWSRWKESSFGVEISFATRF